MLRYAGSAPVFRETGFVSVTSQEKREELLVWFQEHCRAARVLFMRDHTGRVTYAYYDPKGDQVVSIATRIRMELKGNRSKMPEVLCATFPTLKIQTRMASP
jgi:hypothetical protein